MCDPPYLLKREVLAQMRAAGIEPPRLYAMGFSHNNCGGFCIKAGQGQFANLLRVMPERYAYHEEQEERIRDLLGDVSILRNRRGGQTTPLTLRALRERIQAGQSIDMFDGGDACGCGV